MERSQVDDKKPKTVGESLAEVLKAGGRVTDWAIIRGLFEPSSESLPFVTEINSPVEMSLCDRMAERDLKYGVTARASWLFNIRVNMCSHKRKRVLEVIEGWVSVSLQNLFKGESVSDKLFGGRRD